MLPWADQPAPNPVPQVVGSLPRWEQLDSYLTPAGQFFTVAHYGQPAVDAQAWRLEVGGLVDRPLSLTLADLRARPRQEVVFTLECSGNHGLPFLTSAVGTARWGGTPLAPLLAEAGVQAGGSEVVFWGADAGEETVRDVAMTQHFARSMSVADATDPTVLLCDEMNGAPLPPAHGAPLRLLAPGWYGVANVKWLTRIEVRDTRLMNRFMARDYVTLREEPPGRGGRGAGVGGDLGGPGPAEVRAGQGDPPERPAPHRRGGLGRPHRGRGGADRRRAVGAGGARPHARRGRALRLDAVVARLGRAGPGRAHGHRAGDRHGGERPAGPGRPLARQQEDLLGEHRPGHAADSSPRPARRSASDPGPPAPGARGPRSRGAESRAHPRRWAGHRPFALVHPGLPPGAPGARRLGAGRAASARGGASTRSARRSSRRRGRGRSRGA